MASFSPAVRNAVKELYQRTWTERTQRARTSQRLNLFAAASPARPATPSCAGSAPPNDASRAYTPFCLVFAIRLSGQTKFGGLFVRSMFAAEQVIFVDVESTRKLPWKTFPTLGIDTSPKV